MRKSSKRILAGFIIGILATGFVGCSNNEENNDNTNIEQTNFEPVKFIYSNEGKNYEVTVSKPAEKAVTLSQFMTEMLLSLGLQDKMVATALLDNPILPEFKEAYDKIPVLEIGEGHAISKEAFIATGADFVSGWDSSISDQTTGSPDELISKGITPFLAKSYEADATIDDVYEDFRLVGRIFGVEDKANEIIEKMKADIITVNDKIKNVNEEDRVNVMVYDAGVNDAIVVGSGLANNLISLAGGNNIYAKEATKPYIAVSFESIVARNPEVILVTDYEAGDKPEDKIKFLKSHPALKDVDAIKNNRIYVVGLADLSPGVRNSKVIEKMNGYFYGDSK